MSSLLKFNTPGHLFQPFHALFDEAMDHPFFSKAALGTIVPAVNIREGIKHYALEVAIPGYKKEDIKVEIDRHHVLTISGQMEENNVGEDRITRKEFAFNSFTRSFNLPDDIDKQGMTAGYEQGILTVHVPKLDKLHASETSKTIEVN